MPVNKLASLPQLKPSAWIKDAANGALIKKIVDAHSSFFNLSNSCLTVQRTSILEGRERVFNLKLVMRTHRKIDKKIAFVPFSSFTPWLLQFQLHGLRRPTVPLYLNNRFDLKYIPPYSTTRRIKFSVGHPAPTLTQRFDSKDVIL